MEGTDANLNHEVIFTQERPSQDTTHGICLQNMEQIGTTKLLHVLQADVMNSFLLLLAVENIHYLWSSD